MIRAKRWLMLGVALPLALGACGSSTKSGSGSPSTIAKGILALKGSLNLAVNPWDGSEANAEVAKVILESRGVKVTLTKIDENLVWPKLDAGTIDANLEVWPSGHANDIKTYITEKRSVANIGLLGPDGHIGWFIPKFVADDHPEFKTWEGLKSKAAAKYFATAETGDQGQFLLGDPSYVSYDKDIIKNLGLPFKVVTGGSEATLITTMDKAFKNHTPLLFYFYTPQWANHKYQLVSVKLPDVTPACTASAAGQGKDGKYNCDYPTDHLLKVMSTKFALKNPGVYKFLTKMKWTSDDQNTVTTYKNQDGMTPEAAAKKWVDANQATWKAWLN